MSAERIGGVFRFQCDHCPEAISTNSRDFHEALGEAKAEGFIAYSRAGMWFHACANCKGEVE